MSSVANPAIAVPSKTTKTTKRSRKSPEPVIVEDMTLGVTYSLAAVVIGIVLWLILWTNGFMASFVSFAIAYLAVKLYLKGANMISRNSAIYLMVLILAGVVLAFLSGLVNDLLTYYHEVNGDISTFSALTSTHFWSYAASNIFANAAMWGSYAKDAIIAVVFAGLGIYSVMKDLVTGFFTPTQEV